MKNFIINICLKILWHLADDAHHTVDTVKDLYDCGEGKDAYGEKIPEEVQYESCVIYEFHFYENYDKVREWLNEE